MATFKVTWFFEDNTDLTGWTENWWVSATSAADALTTVNGYKVARTNLLLDTTTLNAVRACSIDPTRDSTFDTASLPMQGTIPRATYPSAGVWDCLLCRRDISSGVILGHMFMHQVPAGIFVGRAYDPALISALGWVAKFAAFVTEVTGGNYLLRSRTGGGSVVYTVCTTFTGLRRTERRLGRPFDALRGRRAVA